MSALDWCGLPQPEQDLLWYVHELLERQGLNRQESLLRILDQRSELAGLFVPVLRKLGAESGLVDSELFEPITKLALPEVTGFRVANHFMPGVHAGVRIETLGSKFEEAFLRDTTLEVDAPAGGVRVHRLRQRISDDCIVEALGGISKVAISLARFWQLLQPQGSGQSGELLTNGGSNLAFVLDDSCRYYFVCFNWLAHKSAWQISANLVRHGSRLWSVGGRVFTS